MAKKNSLGASLAKAFMYLHGLLPLKYHYFWARIIAWLLRSVLRYRTDIVAMNLSRCFPEMKYDQLRDTLSRFYGHFARITTEMIWFGACRGEKGRARIRKSHIVELTNPGELNRLMAESGQVMLLQAHTGNWELIGGIAQYSYTAPLSVHADNVTVAYHGIASSAWGEVMAWNRTAPVCDLDFQGYVHTDSILRYVLAHRGEPRCYFMITDQYPYVGNGSMDVEFMHQPTRSMTAATALACKLDMAVGYLHFREKAEGAYTLTVETLCDHASAQTPEALMKRYYELLEGDLREQPWNYLWTHKRWK